MTPPVVWPRSLVLASAGSGKTYLISSAILGLLASGERPAGVFASTFTRKAAGEILDRVLVRLAGATLGEAEARKLSEAATKFSGQVVDRNPAEWGEVLRTTLESLNRLDVGTLDAFFLRTLRAFGNDLGLPPGWSIVDEATALRLRADALEDVLTGLALPERVELVRGLSGGLARRSVHTDLMRMLGSLTATHRAIDPEAPGWKGMRACLPTDAPDLDVDLFELAARVEGIVPPLTKAGTPVSAWAKAITKIAEDLRGSDPAAVVGRGLFQKATSSEPSEFGRHEVPPGVRTIMTQVSVQLRALVARDLVTRAEALGRLADHYGVALDQRILQSGSLRFEDVPRLLSGPRPTGARADLRYRMDSAVEHVLLDEFQDTSLEQWAALQPVMDAIIQDGEDTHGTAVVVADPKQSIYGWRGAAPVLVHAVGGRYALEPDRLPVSWRSSQVVLDTVNQVFEDLPVSAVLDHEKGDDLTAAAWVEDFQPHRAAEPRLGHVRLLAGPEGSRGDSPELTTFVVDRIGELHQEAPGHSIGVLTRTNQMVAGIIDGLRRRGIPASEEGGTGLMDSAGVASVVALLRVADHPGDRLSRYHVARTPIGAVMRLGDPDDPVAARAVALRLRRGLMELGYGSVLAALVDGLAGHCTTRELRRLHQLVGLGYRYDGSRRTDRIADFVRTVESERVEAPEAGGVRVMTIHGSKGLEFDAVVLPELHAPWFRGGNDGPVGYRPTGIGPITHAFPYIAENERRLFADCPELIGAHAQARAGGLRDALGALYVGMTRARHSLLMIVPSGGGSGQSAARLLRERLVVTDPDAPEIGGSVLFETGDPTWAVTPAEGREETDQHPPAGADGPIRIRLRSDDPPRRNLPRSRPSGLEGSDAPSIETLLRAPSRWQGRDRGTLVHRWLESMAWIEDWSPDMVGFRAVARIVAPRLPTDGVENAWSALNEQLEAPQIRAHLSRENHPPGSRVERELPFLLEIDEALMEGIIDRVVLVEENGVAVRAEISDYKTDKVGGPDEIGEKVAFYAPQLEAYRRAVSLLFGIRTDHVDAYIVFLDAATVVPVPSSAIIPPTEEPVG